MKNKKRRSLKAEIWLKVTTEAENNNVVAHDDSEGESKIKMQWKRAGVLYDEINKKVTL